MKYNPQTCSRGKSVFILRREKARDILRMLDREELYRNGRFAVWEGFQLAVADRLLQHFNEK